MGKTGCQPQTDYIKMKANNFPKYLVTTQSHKIEIGNKNVSGYLSGIIYMAPARILKGHNACPYSSKQCRDACLFTAGRLVMSPAQKAMRQRSLLFWNNRKEFERMLKEELTKLIKKANKKDLKAIFRFNGTSDFLVEKLFPWIFKMNLIVYDYTKYPLKYRTNRPKNYYLCQSHHEDNHYRLHDMLKDSNVVVVFSTKRDNPLPASYQGVEVIDGDLSDYRFLDKGSKEVGFVIVGVRAKGKARKLQGNNSSFVVSV